MTVRALICLALICLTPAFPRPADFFGSPTELDLRNVLPAASDLKGWTPKDPPRVFKGDDLFLYIDGGAEVYNEYGFKQVIAQDYRDPKGRSVSLEVYEMADAAAAYGMFTFKSSGKGHAAAAGQDGQLEDYYLNFWKGPCLVTAVGFDDSVECLAGIMQIAEAVDARLKATGPRPKLASVFPREWADVSRVVYLKGPLAVDNIYASLSRDLLHFKEGTAAERGPFKIFVLRYENAPAAKRSFADSEQATRRNAAWRNFKRIKSGAYEAEDAKGNSLHARLFGDRIHLVVDSNRPSDRTSAGAILAQLEKIPR